MNVMDVLVRVKPIFKVQFFFNMMSKLIFWFCYSTHPHANLCMSQHICINSHIILLCESLQFHRKTLLEVDPSTGQSAMQAVVHGLLVTYPLWAMGAQADSSGRCRALVRGHCNHHVRQDDIARLYTDTLFETLPPGDRGLSSGGWIAGIAAVPNSNSQCSNHPDQALAEDPPICSTSVSPSHAA